MATNIKDFKILAEKFTELDERIESYNKNLEEKIIELEEELVKVNFKKENGITLEVNCFHLDEHWITYVVQ